MNQTVLTHHGIPGQKWGIRRFQRPDGSLTAKRGEIGVHTAVADAGYDLNQLQKGVFKSGKVAYKKENLIRGGD